MLSSKLASAVPTAGQLTGLQENGSSEGPYPKLHARGDRKQVTGNIDIVTSMRKLSALLLNLMKT